MPRIEWERGFRRLTFLASGVLLALGLIAHAPESVVISLVAAPWAIFLIVRWLVQGFRSPAEPVAVAPVAPPDDHFKAINKDWIETPEGRAIIEKGAREGKTVSREKCLKYLIELRETYDGPDREKAIIEFDRQLADFRARFPEEIPVDQAYDFMKELDAKIAEAEKSQ